jgi:hypothetical protein
MVTLRDLKTSFNKCIAAQNMIRFFIAMVFVAQTCGLQFFPIYLKYLNFSALEVGIIRASQTWISMLLVPAWLLITKRLKSLRSKRFVILMFLVVSITLHLCLTFLPQSNTLQDVTHCHEHTVHQLKEKVLKHDDRQYDHFKPTLQVPFHTANVTVIKATSSPLNRTIRIIHSEHNKLLLDEKLVPQMISTDEVQDASIEQTPTSVSDRDKIYQSSEVSPQKTNNVIAHNTPIHKIWHFRRHSSQSEPWNAYSNKKIHNLRPSEKGYIPISSERNKVDDIELYKTLVPQHADIPSVQHKNVRKYYASGSRFSGSHATSDYPKTRNPEDSFSDEQSTYRLQADIVAGMGDPIESPQESMDQINVSSKTAGVRLWREHQNLPQLLMWYKSGKKMEQAGHKENSLPITGEENNLLAVRMIHENMKQNKGLDPHERHRRRKHISRSDTSESQEGEQFSENGMKEFTIQQPVQHRLKDRDKDNTIHRRRMTSQHSSLAKTLNYNEKRETNNTISTQGTVRGPMIANSSEYKHDNDTDIQLEKIVTPWLNKNTSMQPLNDVAINFPDHFSTTFGLILILAILACVFYRAIATVSSKFLQCENTVVTSRNVPLTSSYQHIFTLLGWGVFGCPILVGAVLATQCSYQPRVFFLFSAGLFMINLLMLFLLKLPGKSQNLKLWDHKNEENRGHMSFLQR